MIAFTTAEDSNRTMTSGSSIIALPPKCWITLATSDGRVRPMPSVCAYSLSWAPDGKHIAYQAPDGIWTVRADGTDARHVDGTLSGVVGFTTPIWSRDATRLVAYDFTTLELAVVGLDDTGIRHLASTYRQELSCGNWSPDGRALLCARDRSLWEVDVDSDAVHERIKLGVAELGQPKWSPDGSRIAFLVLQSGLQYVIGPFGSGSQIGPLPPDAGLWVMNADGTAVRQLVHEYVVSADWSPDGRTLLYAPRTPNKSMSGFYTIPSDGSGAPKLLIRDAAHTFTSGVVWAQAH